MCFLRFTGWGREWQFRFFFCAAAGYGALYPKLGTKVQNCIPHGYIHGRIDPRHDIENCCSYLYICLWIFKYTKITAVFFYSITLSLEMSDEPLLSVARRKALAKQTQ